MKRTFTLLCATLCLHASAQKTLYDFGLKGNASVDESALLQNAINASAGQTLIVPDDTFYVRDLAGISNLKIERRGNGMLKYAVPDCPKHGVILRLRNCNNVTIDGIIFDGSYPEPFGTALEIIYSSNIIVKNCTLQNNYGEAIVLGNVTNATIDNNKEINTDVGVLTAGGCNQVRITRNYAKGGTSDGVFIFGRKEIIDSNIVVSDSQTFEKRGGNGFGTRFAKKISFFNCNATNCHTGIGSDDELGVSKEINIKGCKLINSDKGIAGSFDQNSMISNNFINSATFGMWIGSTGSKQLTYNTIVTDNTIQNTTTAIIATGCVNCVFNKNLIKDLRAKASTYSGVYIMYGSNNVVINNTIEKAIFPVVLRFSDKNFVVQNKGVVVDQGKGNTRLNNMY